MGRKWVGVVVLVVAVGAAVAIAAASRGRDHAPKPYNPPAASKQFGDDADLMRRLERKKLVQSQTSSTHR
jgi:hypothetical protein